LAYPLFLYLKIAVLSLAATFLIHLCLRAYWVGLIGLNSVLPGGPTLTHLKHGPHYLRHLDQYRTTDPSHAIERADNRATLLFAFGVGMAVMMIIPALIVTAVAVFALLLRLVLDANMAMIAAFVVVLLPIMLLAAIPSMVDKYYGHRIAQDSCLGRLLWHCYGQLRRIGMDGASNLPMLYLYGLARNYRSAALMFGSLGFVMASIAMFNTPKLNKIKTADKVAAAMEASDYGNQRGDDSRFALRAFIPAPQMPGSWLDLTVPLPIKQPKNSLHGCTEDSQAIIRACLKKHIRLSLDGVPITADWQEQAAAEGRAPALRAMIDVRELPRGAHTLIIDYLPNTKKPSDAWQERILFWN
jgi:hypothetical protein